MTRRPPRKAPRFDHRSSSDRFALDGSALLRQAVLALRRDQTSQAIELAERALALTAPPAEHLAARQIMAEAHFRAGCRAGDPDQRLSHLDQALALQPDEARLRFYRAIALWQLDRLPDAQAELQAVAAREPERPGLGFLLRLARLDLGDGSAARTGSLTPVEAATMHCLECLWRGETPRPAPDGVEPLGGRELWQALAAMDRQPEATPVDALSRAERRTSGRAVRRIVHYYRGLAALRAGEREAARAAFRTAQEAGYDAPWAEANLRALLRESATALAEVGRWSEVTKLARHAPKPITDAGLAETLALAFDHLGYDAVQQGQWRQAATQWQQANALAATRGRAQNLALAEEALENWIAAAEAWREMVRRRPRKADHPDYLSDAQVAAIWAHAAECYQRADDPAEAAVCLKTALKYAPADADLRLELAQALDADDRAAASENELRRILEHDPDNVDALIRLGILELDGWRDPVPTWRHALALAPHNDQVRDGLAAAYIKWLNSGWFDAPRDREQGIAQALADLPDHPALLIKIAGQRQDVGRRDEAQELYLRAYRAAPDDSRIIGAAMHELLHLEAVDAVADLVEAARALPGLLPLFWVDRGAGVVQCQLGDAWAIRFFDEAVDLAAQPSQRTTVAEALINVFDAIWNEDNTSDVREHYAERIRREVPDSGAVEYIAAHDAFYLAQDSHTAERLLQEARRRARRAGEAGVAKAVAEELERIRGPRLNPRFLRRLLERFPDGPPSLDELLEMPDDFFKDLD